MVRRLRHFLEWCQLLGRQLLRYFVMAQRGCTEANGIMMLKDEASEAVPIVQRALLNLLTITPTRGSAGADLKAAVGLLYASAEQLIYLDQLGQPLSDCFELARTNNITQSQLDWVRQQTELELPVTVGATMIKESIIRLCLVTEG